MSLLKEELELDVQEAELATQKVLSQFPPLWRWLLILIIIALIPAYYISRSISEKIWLSRYEETALMAKPSFTTVQSPSTTPVFLTTMGSGVYAAAVKISNENLNLSVENLPYQFDFYNAQKQTVYTYNGTTFLLPNETKYIIAPKFNALDTIVYSDFQLPPASSTPWQNRFNIPEVQLITSPAQTSTQVSPPAFVAQGNFFNDSPYELNEAYLTFILFDSSGDVIGVSQRDEFTIAPFERRAYVQQWPNLLAPNFARIEVDADTNTLDPTDLSLPESASSSASSLSR